MDSQTASFYYLRSELTYGEADSVIAAESHDTTGHDGDLKYLLLLYLTGPTDEALASPFPADTRLLECTRREDVLTLVLDDSFAQLTGMSLTKACVCLAMTCFDLTDVQAVSIRAQSALLENAKSIEITRDSLVLQNTVPEGGIE